MKVKFKQTHRADNDPPGLDPATVTAANAAHDARYGFAPKSLRLHYPKLRYPPYLPVAPDYRPGVTTAEEIFAWHDRWQRSLIESPSLTAHATDL